MDTVINPGNFAKQTEDIADRSADKIQGGIKNGKEIGSQGADRMSKKIDSVQNSAGSALGKMADQAESMWNQTVDSVSATGKKVRSTVSDVGESVVTYAKDNPVKAILISAAAGALMAAVVRALPNPRD
jgi:ElaB/YqjD/DUF883 family membrane-anchored ribosome-binding protein